MMLACPACSLLLPLILPTCNAQTSAFNADGRIAVDAGGEEIYSESPSAVERGDGGSSTSLADNLLETGQTSGTMLIGNRNQAVGDTWTISDCPAGTKTCRYEGKLILAHFTAPENRTDQQSQSTMNAIEAHTSVQHREDCAMKCLQRLDCMSIHYANQSKACSLYDADCRPTSGPAPAGLGQGESWLCLTKKTVGRPDPAL
jgi:hypothetical protein